jgi:hypothetical protein
MADIMADRNTATTPAKRVGRPPKSRGAANSSDAADARWTVRGVPVNVRAIAIKASENKGMTVGRLADLDRRPRPWRITHDAITALSLSLKQGFAVPR